MKKISNIIFTTPLFNEKHSAWVEHIPFAFFLVDILRPKVFLELGTHYGNSYFAFCQAISELRFKSKAYAVDSWTGDEQAGFYGPEVFEYVTRINNQHFSHFSNLLKMSFEDAAGCFSNGTIDLLHIDGRHGYQHVKDDFETWLPKMSKNGVMIFHDTNVREPGFGVWKLMEEIRNQYLSMEFDHGHGLGIICTGSEVNSDFLDFVAKSKKDIFIEQLFSNRGHQVWLDQQNNNKQKELDQLKDLLKSKSAEIIKQKTLLFEKEIEVSRNERNLSHKDDAIILLKSEITTLTKTIEDEVLTNELENKIHKSEITTLTKTIEDEVWTRELENNIHKSEINLMAKTLAEKEEVISMYILQNAQVNKELIELNNRLKTHVEVLNQIYKSYSWRITKPFRQQKLGRLIRYIQQIRTIFKIKLSRLFDRTYYLKHNSDVKKYDGSPLKHYLNHGGFEGRNPGADFNSRFYLNHYPDVAASGMNPLLHYILYGKKENRLIHSHATSPKHHSLMEMVFFNKHIKKLVSKFKKLVFYNRDMHLVKKSGLFDTDYYLRTNADVRNARVNPIKHYYFHGWMEGRNPSNEFNTQFYLSSNEDVKKSQINPLVHYIKYGKLEGRLIQPFIFNEQECVNKADISDIDLIEEIDHVKVAVVFHLFHVDLIDEFIDYFGHIPVKYDLFISTTSQNQEVIQALFEKKLPDVKTTIMVFENKGKDIGSFIAILKTHLMKYDLVCKVHTKKSEHNHHLQDWRKYLLDHLLGNSLIVKRIISAFIQNKKLGIVWPVAHPYLVHLGLENVWGPSLSSQKNYSIAKSFFPELQLDENNGSLMFPNGSMFWFRPETLGLLVQKEIDFTHFEEENQQIDGTLAHAIERLFGIIAQKAGFEIKTVFFPQKILASGKKPHDLTFNQKKILFVAHDLSTAGAEILLLNLLTWLNSHTSFNLYVIALKPGIDGGKLLPAYKKVSKVYLWDEFCSKYTEEEAIQKIYSETGMIDLIYGNTIVSASLYPLLDIFEAPFISHIHEMEKSIRNYTTQEVRDKLKEYTSIYIPCSTPVMNNLMVNHQIVPDQLKMVTEFIHTDVGQLPDHSSQRILYDLPKGKIIIWGCGTIYWRKGTDLFIEIAKKLKENGVDNFLFCWIGANYWDLESAEWGEWKEWENYIQQHDLTAEIVLLGERVNPKDYFKAGDIFFLPSREDPFPLVCLEAAECALPIVCFEDAGGMPEFVEDDAGSIVPYLDIDDAAKALGELIVNKSLRQEKGMNARAKILTRYSDDIAVPQILKICHSVMKSNPLVSVIVPVYNHGKFLNKRIESILSQSFKDFEIIVLDDASTDNSYEIAMKYSWHPAVSVIRNDINTSSPFIQWEKGFSVAKGEIIWFAEGDDFCMPDFLQKLLPCFNDKEVALAYCDSFIVDESDAITGDYEIYHEELDAFHWKNSYQNTGSQEINFGLGVKNSIPNASAVLLRKQDIPKSIFNELAPFKFSGDWFFYSRVIRGKQIAFNSEKLNCHRKHLQTVTSKFNSIEPSIQVLLKEQQIIHEDIFKTYQIDSSFLKKWEIFIAGQLGSFYLAKSVIDFDQVYPYSIEYERIKKAIVDGEQNNRFVFLTTNDYSPNGGSEQLWRKAAVECSKRGNEVMVVIKKWNPEPFFINEFRKWGVSINFKEPDSFNRVTKFEPDLMVISIGDQDEGIEWYEHCLKNKIPYVIVNQLTKEPKYWPVKKDIAEQVKSGYLGAELVLFTGKNNHELMERRLDCKIPRAKIFYNPLDVDRDLVIPFPTMDDGLQLAIPANLSRVHKGQHLALQLFSLKKWRQRRIHLNIYGTGYDEDILKEQALEYHLNNVTFHGHIDDITSVWKKNHAIFMPSFMEGLPLALVGAMLCERVPIVTNIGSHSEVIDDNISGFIANYPTVEALDEALERAFQKSAGWKKIGIKARMSILTFLPQSDPVDDFISKIMLTLKSKR